MIRRKNRSTSATRYESSPFRTRYGLLVPPGNDGRRYDPNAALIVEGRSLVADLMHAFSLGRTGGWSFKNRRADEKCAGGVDPSRATGTLGISYCDKGEHHEAK